MKWVKVLLQKQQVPNIMINLTLFRVEWSERKSEQTVEWIYKSTHTHTHSPTVLIVLFTIRWVTSALESLSSALCILLLLIVRNERIYKFYTLLSYAILTTVLYLPASLRQIVVDLFKCAQAPDFRPKTIWDTSNFCCFNHSLALLLPVCRPTTLLTLFSFCSLPRNYIN